jgi:5'-nucleotidase
MRAVTLSIVASGLLVGLIFGGCNNDDTPSPLVEDNRSALVKLSSFDTNTTAGSEIVTYDYESKRMYITNGASNMIDIVDISNPASPVKFKSIDLSTYGSSVQSVAAKSGTIAVAVGSASKTATKGKVVFFEADGTFIREVTVGYLPDMVTFNEDGTKVIVANEGEPDATSGTYVDAVGSIGIITVATGAYVDLDFASIALSAASDGTIVRLGGTPSNDKTKDIEPEYITVSGDYAYVTLQENNAIAKVNLTNNTIVLVQSLGAKSYETTNTIDIHEEGIIKMKNYKGLFSLYMPDTIASYVVDGKTYLVTANEGDGREWLNSSDKIVFTDEVKISKLTLDDAIKSEYATENDLKVMKDLGETTLGSKVYNKLYTYGGRSFSIWNDKGVLVWDSGDEISKKIAAIQPDLFNQDDGVKDGRSGNKGGEPEALTIGVSKGKTYAFVGLERQNAILVYDITSPSAPKYVDYIITGTDKSPEGMKFIPASQSPNGKNLLLVSYEVSGSTAIYEFTK